MPDAYVVTYSENGWEHGRSEIWYVCMTPESAAAAVERAMVRVRRIRMRAAFNRWALWPADGAEVWPTIRRAPDVARRKAGALLEVETQMGTHEYVQSEGCHMWRLGHDGVVSVSLEKHPVRT